MNKKVVFITGATSGIGKETAVELAKKGFIIVFTAINKKEGETAQKEIITRSKNKDIEFIVCDLSSFKQIVRCTEAFNKKYTQLDILINNAGVWMPRRRVTIDGYEYTFQVNYLSPFLLTCLLISRLKKGSRIINVSSEMYRFGKIDLNDLDMEKKYNSYRAYSNSKLALLLFTKELAKRLDKRKIIVNAVHPGFVASNITDKKHFIGNLIFKTFGTNPKKAAETIIHLATITEFTVSGEYFYNKKIRKTSKKTNDKKVMQRLWYQSQERVKKYL